MCLSEYTFSTMTSIQSIQVLASFEGHFISLTMALHHLWTLAAFSVFNLYTVGRTGDQSVASRYLHRTTQTQNKRTQTSIPWMGLKPTIPVFELAKMFHVSSPDRAATVIRLGAFYQTENRDRLNAYRRRYTHMLLHQHLLSSVRFSSSAFVTTIQDRQSDRAVLWGHSWANTCEGAIRQFVRNVSGAGNNNR
jgi:hypothetical protein